MNGFASVADYRLRYPGDATASDARVQAALDDAADMIEARAGDVSGIGAATLLRLACLAASRAMKAQESGLDGLDSLQRTAGPYSVMLRPANGSGGAYLLDSEWAQLGVGVGAVGFMAMWPEGDG